MAITLPKMWPATAPKQQEIGHCCQSLSQSSGIGIAPAQPPKTLSIDCEFLRKNSLFVRLSYFSEWEMGSNFGKFFFSQGKSVKHLATRLPDETSISLLQVWKPADSCSKTKRFAY